VLVDANDSAAFSQGSVGVDGNFTIVHIAPGVDDISRSVGRGSRTHMFYWRHSPQVFSALPASPRLDAYSDADLLFLRPLDLGSVIVPLEDGRIAAAVDESSLDHYLQIGELASTAVADLFPTSALAGPLLQTGLILCNPYDNGGFYNRFWDFAIRAARCDLLDRLPSDDMFVVSALLGQGGLLWDRLLTLGNDWNYITDSTKDPGIFGRVAHYGGRRAKTMILKEYEHPYSPAQLTDTAGCWGTVTDADTSRLQRGAWPTHVNPMLRAPIRVGHRRVVASAPLCLSWLTPADATALEASATTCIACGRGVLPSVELTLFMYIDGRLVARTTTCQGSVSVTAPLQGAETISLVAVSSTHLCRVAVEVKFPK
jgi:hypothetical protein